jgi:hypothetical protein
MKQLMISVSGSKLYRTDTVTSDLDLKAVHIPAPQDILLQRASKVINSQTKIDKGAKNGADDIDFESFALQHYLKLLMEGQTIALEMLFTPDEYLRQTSKEWKFIQANRTKLLSKKCQSFIGYARAQASRYGIRGERVAAVRKVVEALDDQLEHYSTQTKVGQFETTWNDLALVEQIISIVPITLNGGTIIKHLECCDRKIPFTSTIKEAKEVFQHVLDEYGHRALAAENNQNIDWKSQSHAIRIIHQSLELLTAGTITLPLSNARYIRDIKLGNVDINQVSKEIDEGVILVEKAAACSKLPLEPDYVFAESLILDFYGLEIDLRAKNATDSHSLIKSS